MLDTPGTARTTPATLVAKQMIEAEASLIAAIPQRAEEQLETIAHQILSIKGKVVFTGAGTSGHVARRAAHLFSVCGTPAMFLQPADALHGGVSAVQPMDALIVVSKGGRSQEVNAVARLAHEIGLPVFSLTSVDQCDISDIVELNVVLPVDDISDPGGIVAMGSTLAQCAWLDALAVVLMRAKDYGFAQVLRSHPSGAVGGRTSLPPDLGHIDLGETGGR